MKLTACSRSGCLRKKTQIQRRILLSGIICGASGPRYAFPPNLNPLIRRFPRANQPSFPTFCSFALSELLLLARRILLLFLNQLVQSGFRPLPPARLFSGPILRERGPFLSARSLSICLLRMTVFSLLFSLSCPLSYQISDSEMT